MTWLTLNCKLKLEFHFTLVVIDTNNWYHATTVEPGEISITIGSEYD